MAKFLRSLGVGAAIATLAVAVPVQAAQPMAASAFVALLTQAEAKSAAKDYAAAAPLWDRIVAANPVEGRYWSSLANARFRSGDYRAAAPAYEKAIELGYAPAISAFNLACSYARVGDKDHAFEALDRALHLGFLDLEALRKDPDLALLQGDPRLVRLVPPLARTARTREEGWRTDLDFLLWQMDRIGAAPYRLHPKSWFEQQFDALAASVPQRTDPQLTYALADILRGLGDAHSGLQGSPDVAVSVPLQFTSYEDGYYVTAADPPHRDLIGARVLGIAGCPISEIEAAVARTVGRDNEGRWVQVQVANRLRYTGLLFAAGLLPGRDAAPFRLRTLDGRDRIVSVPADNRFPDIWNMKPKPAGWTFISEVLPGADPIYMRHPETNYWLEPLPDGRSVYFGFNLIRDDPQESLAAFSRRLEQYVLERKADRLVIDLRWNNGGNTGLLTPLLASLLRLDRINRRGHLFVLIGRRTISAGQNFVSLLERFTRATFAGEPTASSPNFVGEDDAFLLPYSKLMVNVSTLAWQNSLPQDRRTWIAPVIYMPPTFEAVRRKQDPLLDAVLSLPIPD
jgi:tetratricopeptide (TPR) repeat protein